MSIPNQAAKYCKVNTVFPPVKGFTSIAPETQWTLTPTATYVYYCDNETVHGTKNIIPTLNPPNLLHYNFLIIPVYRSGVF